MSCGKGSRRRQPSPCQSQEERDLRYALAYGEITRREFDKQMLQLTGVNYDKEKDKEKDK
jgi:hypothetical protein